jgi:hypothetical protein
MNETKRIRLEAQLEWVEDKIRRLRRELVAFKHIKRMIDDELGKNIREV